jgi:hypothetical protein
MDCSNQSDIAGGAWPAIRIKVRVVLNQHTGVLLSFLMATMLVVLSGCAGMAKGKDSSVLQHEPNLSVVDTSHSQADAWVIIRYPAIIEGSAEEAYYRSYAKNAIGGENPLSVQVRQDTRQIAQAAIAKSNYYAMSLFQELRNELPEGTVLLSPHMIIGDGNGGISSRPLLATEEIPSVVTIDFNVYSFPDSSKAMGPQPLTFGDIVTPIFVVHANRWLRPSTHGLLLSSVALLGTSWDQSLQEADIQFDHGLEAFDAPDPRPLDFVRFLSGGGKSIPDLPLKGGAESRRDVLAVEGYPLEKIRMTGESMASLKSDFYVDPFAEAFVRGAGTRIEKALSRVNHDRATFFARQLALARFDPALAGAFMAAPGNESVRARLMLAEALLAAEKKFLAAQSESIAASSCACPECHHGIVDRCPGRFRCDLQRRRFFSQFGCTVLAGTQYGTDDGVHMGYEFGSRYQGAFRHHGREFSGPDGACAESSDVSPG